LIQRSEIEKILKQAFPGGQLVVEDLTGASDHFQVILVSSQFQGKSPVEQHQMVYAALKKEMDKAIHALTLKTYTPEEWDEVKTNQPAPKGIS